MEFAPSQGLNVALSQYAPNKQIWIKGKQYTSKAIYSPFKHDRRNAWGKRKLYLECSRCGHAKTEEEFDVAKLGQIRTCEACNTPGTFGPAKPWFRPPGFAHPWAQAAVSTPDEPNETAYATRAKLVMPSGGPDMGDAVNSRLRALPTRQHLLVSNSGPGGDGYEYCVRCGRIESVSAPEILLRQPHPVPYPNNGEALCPGYVSRGVVLGTDFPTDIALFALRLGAPFRLLPAESATLSAMRTVCEALAKAACRLLQIESGEVLAEYRPALNAEGAEGVLVEVFLYDTLAGGAGFAPQLASRGEELFKVALGLLEHCPGNCDASCYRCLRGFRNRLDHALLDRRVGAQLLGHILTGNAPEFSLERAAQTLKVLSNDLERQLSDRFEILRDFVKSPAAKAPLILRSKADGKETLIDLCSPIAPDVPIFGTTAATAKLISDLMVRKHLGEAIDRITEGI